MNSSRAGLVPSQAPRPQTEMRTPTGTRHLSVGMLTTPPPAAIASLARGSSLLNQALSQFRQTPPLPQLPPLPARSAGLTPHLTPHVTANVAAFSSPPPRPLGLASFPAVTASPFFPAAAASSAAASLALSRTLSVGTGMINTLTPSRSLDAVHTQFNVLEVPRSAERRQSIGRTPNQPQHPYSPGGMNDAVMSMISLANAATNAPTGSSASKRPRPAGWQQHSSDVDDEDTDTDTEDAARELVTAAASLGRMEAPGKKITPKRGKPAGTMAKRARGAAKVAERSDRSDSVPRALPAALPEVRPSEPQQSQLPVSSPNLSEQHVMAAFKRSRARLAASTVRLRQRMAALTAASRATALPQLQRYRRFAHAQWFRSAIDCLYAEHDAMLDYLLYHHPHIFGFTDPPGRLTLADTESVKLITTVAKIKRARASLGRPRRFSGAFLRTERQRLQQYRQDSRQIQRGQVPAAYSADSAHAFIPEGVPSLLRVGQLVVAKHPTFGDLFAGRILSLSAASMHAQNTSPAELCHFYQVQFCDTDPPGSVAPGIHIVPDTKIAPLNEQLAVLLPGNVSLATFAAVTEPFPNGDDDLPSLARVLRLLDRKETIIGYIRQLNDEVEQSISNGLFGHDSDHPIPQWYSAQFSELRRHLLLTNERMSLEMRALRAKISDPRAQLILTEHAKLTQEAAVAKPVTQSFTITSTSQAPRTPDKRTTSRLMSSPHSRSLAAAQAFSLVSSSPSRSTARMMHFESTTALVDLTDAQLQDSFSLPVFAGIFAISKELASNVFTQISPTSELDASSSQMIVTCMAFLYFIRLCAERKLPLMGLESFIDAFCSTQHLLNDQREQIRQSLASVAAKLFDVHQ